MPNGAKDFDAKLSFLSDLAAWTAARQAFGERLVLCGDLNVALIDADLHPSQIKAGAIGQRANERALLREAIDHGLVDVVRAQNPAATDVFTYRLSHRLRSRQHGDCAQRDELRGAQIGARQRR